MRYFIPNIRTGTIIATAVVGFVLYSVVPQFKKSYEEAGIEVSNLTVSLIWVSDMVVRYFYLAPAILLALYLLHILRGRTLPAGTPCA